MVMKLIHRESMPQKARVPLTPQDSSSARFKHLIDKELSSSDFQVNVQQAIKTSMFYVNFSIGQPPRPQFTIMDTGSSLLWIKCLPCSKDYSSDHKTYNPLLSSTYVECSCSDPFCKHAPNAQCRTSSNKCLYEQVYINGGGSKGVLAKERLTFTTPNGNTVLTSPVPFGCGHENGEQSESDFTGIMGLGAQPTSLALQLGSKFSYCIGDLANKNYGYNQLVLGEDADVLGDPTPFKIENGIYYMNLEGISVGDKQLNIEPVVFTRRGARTGVILDSGTLYTWLADRAYRELHNEVRSILDTQLQRFWFRDLLCYHGRMSEELIGFPVVTFRFSGGAELAMEANSMFYAMTEPGVYQNVFCMAVRPTTVHGGEYKDFTAIGLMAQQYYNVAYDLREKNVYLQRIDCVLLDDYSPS
ncbi:unnamed protein product [Thlaspi arvense]|uniref:Peptidase A1 domain-containing protein n=1 Tax=Thlaspi arvense TaxID=13288 RepID=A0AAU9SC37_THLAR|nr:unnamed protein product [Thlaspi arvense]